MITIDPERAPAEPRDASTVILLREHDADGFETFMVRRHSKSGFMAGAYVFPGGKLDDADSEPSLLERVTGRTGADAVSALGEGELGPTRALGLFVAALRETFEEAGVLLATAPSAVDLPAARARLVDGAPFVELVRELDLSLRLEALVPQARWITPTVEPRRYDTRFFLAVSPPDQRADHDRYETTAGAWMSPRRALERERGGEIQLPPPTMRTLEILESFDSIDAAVEDARSRPPPRIQPVFRDEEGTFVLALPGDPHHPEPGPVIPGPTRFVLDGGRWWSRERPGD